MKCSPAFFLFPYMLDHLERFLYTRRTKILIMLSCSLLIVSCIFLQVVSEDSGLAAPTIVEKL